MGRPRARTEREREFAKALARVLKAKRLEKGIKIEALAAALHVSRDALYGWEKGGGIPVFMLLRAAACLKVPLADLVAPAIFELQPQRDAHAEQKNC